ncbi:hypothetical protein BsWGS_17140 [Bradybaena similaris]
MSCHVQFTLALRRPTINILTLGAETLLPTRYGSISMGTVLQSLHSPLQERGPAERAVPKIGWTSAKRLATPKELTRLRASLLIGRTTGPSLLIGRTTGPSLLIGCTTGPSLLIDRTTGPNLLIGCTTERCSKFETWFSCCYHSRPGLGRQRDKKRRSFIVNQLRHCCRSIGTVLFQSYLNVVF